MRSAHPSEVVLQRIADGEVSRVSRDAVLHLASCDGCARRVRYARAAMSAVRRAMECSWPLDAAAVTPSVTSPIVREAASTAFGERP